MKANRSTERGQAFTLEGFVASVLVLTAILLALQSIVLTPTTAGTVDETVKQQLRTEAGDILRVSAHNVSDSGSCSGRDVTLGCGPQDNNHDLTHVLLFWNGSQRANSDTWAYAIDENIGYGSRQPLFRNETAFGQALEGTFTRRSRVYNVIVEYRNASDQSLSNETRMVYRGVPSDKAITTSYTLTLYDNDTLTGVNKTIQRVDCTERPIEEIKPVPNKVNWNSSMGPDCNFPIPEASMFDDDDQDPPLDPTGTASYCIDQGGSVDCGNEKEGIRLDSPIYNVVEIRVIVW